MRLRWGFVVALLAVGIAEPMVAQQAAASDSPKAATPTGVWAKLDQGLDTTFTKAGEKVSVALLEDLNGDKLKLPKGTKLTGSVVKSVKQDKEHANGALILLFDTAVLKDKSTVPVRVTVTSLAPSPSDLVEKVEMGSGDVTDASASAAKAAGVMDDPNGHASAGSSTKVNGVKATSTIRGVVLFAPPDDKSSGVIVGQAGDQLELHKWARLNVVVTAR